MTRSISLIGAVVGAALVLAPTALGDPWFADRQEQARVSPGVDRAVAASQHRLAIALDARDRSLTERPAGATVSPLDAREKAFGAKREAQLASAVSPDAFERAVESHTGSVREPVVDDRFRIDPTTVPGPGSVAASGREVEWPQIGIGFAIGLLLAAGLYLAMRLSRTRQLAH